MFKNFNYIKLDTINCLYIKKLIYLSKKNKNYLSLINFFNIDKINNIIKNIINIKKTTIIRLLFNDSKFMINNKSENKNYFKEIIYLKYINLIIKKNNIPILLNINQYSKNSFFLINNFLKVINLNKKNIKKKLISIYTLNLSINYFKNNIKKCIKYIIKMTKNDIMLEFRLHFKIKKKNINKSFFDKNFKKIVNIYKKISKINKNFIISIKFNSDDKIYSSKNKIIIFKLLKKILIIKYFLSKKLTNFLFLN